MDVTLVARGQIAKLVRLVPAPQSERARAALARALERRKPDRQ